MRLYVCDRCGLGYQVIPNAVIVPSTNSVFSHTMNAELCDPCTEDLQHFFRKFMKEKK